MPLETFEAIDLTELAELIEDEDSESEDSDGVAATLHAPTGEAATA